MIRKSRMLLILINILILLFLTACDFTREEKRADGCTVVYGPEKVIYILFLPIPIGEKIVQITCPDKEIPNPPETETPDTEKEFDGEITIPENAGDPNAGLNGQLEIDSWKFETNNN